MKVDFTRTDSHSIKDLRAMFLHEGNFQFVYNKCHDYGWADCWLITSNATVLGYGAVWGNSKRQERDTIFEFYITPLYRQFARKLFRQFTEVCGATYVGAQTNDLLLTSMLYIHCTEVTPEAILFEDRQQTHLSIPGAIFRKRSLTDALGADDSDYVISFDGQVVASGGLMLNYNIPYADVYMQVNESFREKGFGSLIVQELKKLAYDTGRVPAARCNVDNYPSQATLLKSGFAICGFRINARLRES